MPPSTLRLRSGQASLRTGIACVHIPRFAVEVERQRRPDIAARLILIGEATVFDCSLGAEASGVRRGKPSKSRSKSGLQAAKGGKRVHTVKPVETLYSIAAANNTTVEALRRDNRLPSSRLQPGDKLVIP